MNSPVTQAVPLAWWENTLHNFCWNSVFKTEVLFGFSRYLDAVTIGFSGSENWCVPVTVYSNGGVTGSYFISSFLLHSRCASILFEVVLT